MNRYFLEQEFPLTYATICGLDVIRFLTSAEGSATGRQISEGTGIPRATIYRTVGELVDTGWLTEEGSPRRYAPSWKVMELGLGMLMRNHVREFALRNLIDLATETGQPVFLSFRDGAETLTTDTIEVVGGRTMPASTHTRVSALVTSAGRCILALLPTDITEGFIAEGVPPPVNGVPGGASDYPTYIRAAIEHARETGLGVCDGEIAPGWVSMSAAVFDGTDIPRASLGLSAPQPRENAESEFGNALRQWARRASIELGYRGNRPAG